MRTATLVPAVGAAPCRPRRRLCSACAAHGGPSAPPDEQATQSTDVTVTRRQAAALTLLSSAVALTSPARGDTLTATRPSLSEATRATSKAGPLPPGEQAVVDTFERLTCCVVNVVDITVAQGGMSSRVGAQVDVPEGNGTGIVWDQEGNIVTNYHVLGSVLAAAGLSKAAASGPAQPGSPGDAQPVQRKIASVARVTLLGTDGKSHEYVADLVGADRAKDLAVIHIPAPPGLLRPITLGTSNSVRVGQTVLAIGNPFGFDHTLTTGVVSGLDRTVQSAAGSLISGGIQTDAAINPGNSGGPLLNSSGQLVGINTAIFTNTGSSAGVGFAIPVDSVQRVVPQLIAFGRIVRAGLNLTLASETIASQLRVKGGALVQAVKPGSAAEAAGLLPTRRGFGGIVTGDVIVGVGDDPVRTPAELQELVERQGVGETVVLHVVRGVGGDAQEQLLDIPVQLEEETGS